MTTTTVYRGTTAEAHSECPGEFWTESRSAAIGFAEVAAEQTGGTPVIVTARIRWHNDCTDNPHFDISDADYGDRYMDAVPGRTTRPHHAAHRVAADDLIEIVAVETHTPEPPKPAKNYLQMSKAERRAYRLANPIR